MRGLGFMSTFGCAASVARASRSSIKEGSKYNAYYVRKFVSQSCRGLKGIAAGSSTACLLPLMPTIHPSASHPKFDSPHLHAPSNSKKSNMFRNLLNVPLGFVEQEITN